MKRIIRTVSYFLVFLYAINLSFAQEIDTVDLNSPHDCIYNHLFYLQSEQYKPEIASQSFKLAKDNLTAIKNASQLKQILDAQGLFVYMNKIPALPNYVDSLTGKSIYTLFPDQLPEIYLVKSNNEWLYAPETNIAISKIFKKTYPFGSHRLVNYFNDGQQSTFLGIALWQFIAILLILLFSFLLYRILSAVLHLVSRTMTKVKLTRFVGMDKDYKLSQPASIIIVLYFVGKILPIVQLPVKWIVFNNILLTIIVAVLTTIILMRLVDILIHNLSKMAEKTEDKLDEQLMPILHRLLKIVIVIIASMYVLKLLDFDITALIAGVSIGGLALALAAQDTVKNLIGSLMIFLDSPYQIGDYIIVNGMEGTVTEVGFRSTRIKTIDSSIITIPNGNLSSTSLTNKGARIYRLFNTQLTITYNTPSSKIKEFIAGLKSIIKEHPLTDSEAYYVHLSALNSSSIDILFRATLLTSQYDSELKIKEELLFSIISLAESLEVDFAFPTQSIVLEKK